MIRLGMENYTTMLIEKQLKYQLYHLVKFISMNISLVKIYYHPINGEDILSSNQQQIIEQTKFTYSPLGKAFEKQIKTIEDAKFTYSPLGKAFEKQIGALKNI